MTAMLKSISNLILVKTKRGKKGQLNSGAEEIAAILPAFFAIDRI